MFPAIPRSPVHKVNTPDNQNLQAWNTKKIEIEINKAFIL